MPLKRSEETGRYVSSGPQPWQLFVEKHRAVKEWLENRPSTTQGQYCRKLINFCEATGLPPEDFLKLNRFEARDTVWKFVKPFIRESTSKAKNHLAALKSFYRSKDGEVLPFDSRRGGKHYFNTKRRKKAAKEYVPTKAEMYRVIDMANNSRDKAVLLMLFQSGIRVGALCNLRFKDVKNQLYRREGPKIPLKLTVTDEIDTKLRGYSISCYYSFLQGEAVEALKAYCDNQTKNDEDPLFISQLGNRLSRQGVWETLKRCVEKAGLDPENMWTHTVRRAFRDVLRHSDVKHEFQEVLMGHVLPGSEENYFSRTRVKDVEAEYMKIDFSREIARSQIEELKRSQKREIEKLQNRIGELEEKNLALKERLNGSTLSGDQVQELLKRIEKLEQAQKQP